MRRQLTRILGILSLAAFVVTLAAWPLSYVYSCSIAHGRWGFGIRSGGYYVTAESDAPPKWVTDRIVFRRNTGRQFEWSTGESVQRWKPVRGLESPYFSTLIVVAGWVPPLAFTFPAWLTVRRWRRARGEVGRGFDVAGVA